MFSIVKAMDQNLIFKEIIQDELEQFDVYLRNALKSDNRRIADIVEHSFQVSGKRIRPTLVLLVAKACGGVTPATYHGAVTVELLHTATLIHDDVIDESFQRRGQPSANAVYDNKRSVLAGDYLLSSSVLQSVKTENLEVVEIISELGKNLSEGELNQYALADEVVIDQDEYFEVIDKKTASLMRASITIGAITGGADSSMISRFTQLGSILGICFQIRDDIFDYFKRDVGKPTGNDIREGKITLPLIYALQQAPAAISDEMLQIINSRDYSDEHITRLLDFAREQGGIDYAYGKIEALIEEAEEIVSGFKFSEEMESLMRLFLSYLKNRKY